MYWYIQLERMWPPIHACFVSICAPRHGTGQLHWAWFNHAASSLPQHRQPQNGGGTVLAETHDANRLTLCLTFHYFCSPAVFLGLITAPPTAQELCEAVWLDLCSFLEVELSHRRSNGKPSPCMCARIELFTCAHLTTTCSSHLETHLAP
jgi:hypothetical protein